MKRFKLSCAHVVGYMAFRVSFLFSLNANFSLFKIIKLRIYYFNLYKFTNIVNIFFLFILEYEDDVDVNEKEKEKEVINLEGGVLSQGASNSCS